MSSPREVLLNYKSKSESDRIPVVLTYHPYRRPVLLNLFLWRPKWESKILATQSFL